ncbi:MAG: NfeD family protein [Thermoprotei archaeon]
MSRSNSVGLLSLARWGVGGSLLEGILVVAGVVSAYEWSRYHIVEAAALAFLLFISAGAIAFVKLTEEIQPMRYMDDQLVGKTAVVVKLIKPGSPGIVKIGYQTWSAYSEVELKEGETVTVTGRDGVYVRVKPETSEGGKVAG